jgi:epoxyqueuosine reductase
MSEALTQIDHHQLAAAIKQWAKVLGFDLVGITSANPSAHRDYFRNWLDEGQHGSMEYLARRFDERTDPATYFPGALSVICVAMNYRAPIKPSESTEPSGRIARYALGDDYHELIKSRLHALADWIREQAPGAQTRACVDTAPVMEKELAARAGIGWFGKNSCIIHPTIGSWIFLGEVITTLDLPHDEPAIDHCGTCTRCIDACPTGAITAPYQLDARKCISYLTIEHRGEIDPLLLPKLDGWLYGCDICQDVCPFNSKAPDTTEPAFTPRYESAKISLQAIMNWNQTEYSAKLKGSAMKRVKLPVLQRNARNLEKR